MSYDAQLPPPPSDPGQQFYPGAPFPPQQQEQKTSGLAIAGLILAFFAPIIGLILSLIAIGKTGAGKAKGRGLAVAGTIIGLVFTIIGVVIIVAVAKNVKSTDLDPGCISGKAAIVADGPNVKDPATLQRLINELGDAANKAKDAKVRDAMNTLKGDYVTFQSGIKTGQFPAGFTTKLQNDANNIDSLCTIGAK